MSRVSEFAKVIADAVASDTIKKATEQDLEAFLRQPVDFRSQLADAIRNLADDPNYSPRVSKELDRIADMIFQKPAPKPEDFPPKLEDMPRLDGLGSEELQELHESVTQCIQDLHDRWSELSHRADPVNDPVILAIFAQLDELEHRRLPDIERRIRQPRRGAIERAA